jgi:hypothetical protein
MSAAVEKKGKAAKAAEAKPVENTTLQLGPKGVKEGELVFVSTFYACSSV